MNTIQEELYFDYFTNRFLKSAQIYMSPISDLKRKLTQLWEQRVLHVEFLDERIFSYGEDLVEILEELMAEEIGFLFSFTCPVQTLIRNQKLLTPLKKVGLRQITLQVVNANSDVLERYGIKSNLQDQYYAIQILKALRIHLQIQYTMFEPMTTIEHLIGDLEFLQENKLVGLAPYSDILTGYLDLDVDGPIQLGYREKDLFLPATDPLLPYAIFDQRVEGVLRWLIFYDGEYRDRWNQIHESLLHLRKELAHKHPNWIVTNQGQELMHLTLDHRLIPYSLFKALLDTAKEGKIGEVTEEQIRRQCDQIFNKIEENYHSYRNYHSFSSAP